MPAEWRVTGTQVTQGLSLLCAMWGIEGRFLCVLRAYGPVGRGSTRGARGRCVARQRHTAHVGTVSKSQTKDIRNTRVADGWGPGFLPASSSSRIRWKLELLDTTATACCVYFGFALLPCTAPLLRICVGSSSGFAVLSYVPTHGAGPSHPTSHTHSTFSTRTTRHPVPNHLPNQEMHTCRACPPPT